MINSQARGWSRASNMRRRRRAVQRLRDWPNVSTDPQLSLGEALSLDRGLEMKALGMARAETRAVSFVQRLRPAVKAFAIAHGSVTADDARRLAAELGLTPGHKNVWGIIFRERGWKLVGYRPSTIRSNHAHRNPVWAWIGDPEAGSAEAADDDRGGAA